MTLIVARANSAGIRMVSDSRVFDPADRKPRPLSGALKTIILNPAQCVCFAGHLDHAQTAVESIFLDELHQRLDDEAVLARLLEAHRNSTAEVGVEAATEFLLGSLLQGEPMLHEIKGGAIASDLKASWLGSANAFELFQRAYHTGPRAGAHDDKAALGRMSAAFNDILHGEHEPENFGDFMFEVGTRRDGFRYRSGTYAFPPQPVIVRSTEWQQFKIGSTAEGWYFCSVLCPERAGIPLVAIYFATAGFGAVLSPAFGRSPIIVEGATPEQFVEQVETEFGVRLVGRVLSEGGALVTFGNA
jgi:hypothetical protein